MHPVDIHKEAVKKANEAVPKYKIGTPEHDKWLAAYDQAVTRAAVDYIYREGSGEA